MRPSDNISEIKTRLLVTGTGRCGTMYVHRLLRKAGFDSVHEYDRYERVGKDAVVSNWLAPTRYEKGDNRLPPAGPRYCAPDAVLHLVRHPLKVMASLPAFSPSWFEYMSYYCGVKPVSGEPNLRRAMRFYVAWNRMIEKMALPRANDGRAMRVRVEDDEALTLALASLLRTDISEFATDELPKDLNTARGSTWKYKKYDPVTWDDMFKVDTTAFEDVKEMCQDYGYDDEGLSWPPGRIVHYYEGVKSK